MAIINRTAARSQPALAAPALRLGPVLLGAGLLIIAIAVLQILQTSRATTASFKIQDLERQKLELETSVRQLEADVAGLSSLARIEQEARRLGLAPAESRESIDVNVPPPPDGVGLPTRFAPREQEAKPAQQDAWWRDLLELLPFY